MHNRITVLASLVVISGCCFGPNADTTSPAADSPAAADPATPAGSPTQASCDVIATLSTCRDIGAAAFVLGEDLQRQLCTGTYTSGGACPTENRVGSCDEGGGTVRRYYSTGPFGYTVETARQDCQIMPGATFTP